MALQTHKQKSLTEKAVNEIKEGDVVVFNDPSAKNDAREQLGVVYRKFDKDAKAVCIAIFPLTPVEKKAFEENQRAYKDDPTRRSILKPKSQDLKETGVNPNYYYTIGLSVRKYHGDKHIPDRDRVRCLPITEETILKGEGGKIKCLKSVSANVMHELNQRMTDKFVNDKEAATVFNGDMLNAAKDTLGIVRNFRQWNKPSNAEVSTKPSKVGSTSIGKAKGALTKAADKSAKPSDPPANPKDDKRSKLGLPKKKR